MKKSEKLVDQESINTAFNSLQELHEHWKNIGPVSREHRENIWERFQIASRKINKKRNDYFLNKKKRYSNLIQNLNLLFAKK